MYALALEPGSAVNRIATTSCPLVPHAELISVTALVFCEDIVESNLDRQSTTPETGVGMI
jgi:hypothetical protein